MPSETTPKTNHSAAVSGLASFHWDVVEVEVVGDLLLRVRFTDGLTGQVRFEPSHLTGVFAALKERALFTQVFVDHGAVAWPGDIDLAPDAMYQAIKTRGEWVLT